MKCAYITIITNNHFGKIEKKNTSDQHCNEWSVCWSEAFFYLPKFLSLSLVFAYIYISQSNVEMHLPCSRIYNNHIMANCLHSVPVK